MTLLSITLVLFFIMDPIGNVRPFLSILKEVPRSRQLYLIGREMLIALAIMLALHFLGEHIRAFLNISETTVRLSSGLILFLAAIGILFPGPNSLRNTITPMGPEPFIVPLAIPLVAGPALMATILLYSQIVTDGPVMLGAIFIAWILSASILISSSFLNRTLGKNGLVAGERLVAMVLVMLAVQRFLEGVQLFVSHCSLDQCIVP